MHVLRKSSRGQFVANVVFSGLVNDQFSCSGELITHAVVEERGDLLAVFL